jgi:SSS family transporter
MHWIDWTIILVYLAWLVWDGIRLSRKTEQVEGYFLAHRSLPWWAVGLSVMATQMSAITLVGTTGQGYADGIRFVQFYFGLPIAMIILSLTLVPFFRRANVYTAYEFLERRFGIVTRLMTSFLFLVSRGLSCGVIISAPAVILSVVLGWNLSLTVLAIGVPTVFYTMKGGVQAVTWADVKQMVVIVAGLFSAIAVLLLGLPDEVGVGSALHVAGSVGKLQAIDFSFDLTERYTFWSGTIAGLFLMLSYFGCDQSQVQRYLTAKSTDQARRSLLMSAYWKIPLQVMILMTGVLVFLFFLFRPAPMLFNLAYDQQVAGSARAGEYLALDQEFQGAMAARQEAALALAAAQSAETPAGAEAAARAEFAARNTDVADVRLRAIALVRDVTGNQDFQDVNYVFPTFVTQYMPVGLVGLFIAAIFAAAMSSVAAELNSLSTATVIDFYRRLFKPSATDAHYLRVSRVATMFWGVFACVFAVFAADLGSLIEVVNIVGSYFYGSILGVFMLAIGVRRANGWGASVGLVSGMLTVALVSHYTPIVFLWLNIVGAFTVVAVGYAVSLLMARPGTPGSA